MPVRRCTEDDAKRLCFRLLGGEAKGSQRQWLEIAETLASLPDLETAEWVAANCPHDKPKPVLDWLRETFPDDRVHRTVLNRNRILEIYPHEYLALGCIPHTVPCPVCMWSGGALDPWDEHRHPVWPGGRTETPDELWEFGPTAWWWAFDWARTHKPSGEAVDYWHPVGERLGYDQLARLRAEWWDSSGRKSWKQITRALTDGVTESKR